MDPAVSYSKSSFYCVSHSSANFASYFPRLLPGKPWWRISGLHFDGLSSRNCAVLRVKSPRKIQSQKNVCIVSGHGEIEDHGENRRMLIFGMGFVGQYLADQLKGRGWKVLGTCTSEEKKKKLEEKGHEVFIFKAEVTVEELILTGLENALCEATHIISSIPPSLGGREDPVVFQLGQLLRQAVSSGKVSWIGYLSSTSVYGHWGGDWVDEDSPTKPMDEGALARLDAEKAWISLGQCMEIPIQVFRLGGIYGPGRRKIYNVVDDDAAPRAEVFSFAKSLLEEKWPCKQLESIETGTPTGNTNEEINNYTSIAEKRVSNRRMKDELKVKLLYPSYKSGLGSIIESMDSCPF